MLHATTRADNPQEERQRRHTVLGVLEGTNSLRQRNRKFVPSVYSCVSWADGCTFLGFQNGSPYRTKAESSPLVTVRLVVPISLCGLGVRRVAPADLQVLVKLSIQPSAEGTFPHTFMSRPGGEEKELAKDVLLEERGHAIRRKLVCDSA